MFEYLVGFVIGVIVAVAVPAVYNWAKAAVTKVETVVKDKL